MLAVQVVGVILMAVGLLLLVLKVVGGESNVVVPGVTVKAPASVLVLLVGVFVFLFPYSPWWPEPNGPQPSPTNVPSLTPTAAPPSKPSSAPPTDKPSPPAVAGGPWRGMPASFNSGIDAAFVNSVGRIYLFKAQQYVRFKDLSSGMESNYPVATSKNWRGMPASFNLRIDAATANADGQIYFFRGDRYVRFTDVAKGMDQGYPIVTSKNWRGMPASFNSGIDAALKDANGDIYFFRSDSFVRFTDVSKGMDPGYPKAITTRWMGMPDAFDAGIDAALMTADGAVYFYNGDEYVRFSAGQTSMDPGYPRKIGS